MQRHRDKEDRKEGRVMSGEESLPRTPVGQADYGTFASLREIGELYDRCSLSRQELSLGALEVQVYTATDGNLSTRRVFGEDRGPESGPRGGYFECKQWDSSRSK